MSSPASRDAAYPFHPLNPFESAVAVDYLIVGGGAAGLALAYHIALEPRLAGKKVLLIEPDAKDRNDRTWSWWSDAAGPFDGLAVGEWSRLAFRSPGFEKILDLGRYRYRTVRGLDYYRFVRAALLARPAQFTLLQGTVTALENTATGVLARSTAGDITARYAFDSRPPAVEPQPAKFRYLLSSILWAGKSKPTTDVFDPAVVEFMDFRGAAAARSAVYVRAALFGPRTAPWSSTPFFRPRCCPKRRNTRPQYGTTCTSTLRLMPDQYRLPRYGRRNRGHSHDRPPAAGPQVGAHIIFNLGTRGGRAKPSTGYAFRRIQAARRRGSWQALADHRPPAPRPHRRPVAVSLLFDTLLLDIMQRRGETTRDIFRAVV